MIQNLHNMQNDIIYEVVKSANTDELIELYKEGGWWNESPDERCNLPVLVENSFCFMVAKNPEGRIIGMGRVISDGVSDGYIQDVIVYKIYRNKGIGKEIVIKLKDFCLKNGLTWIGLIAEPGTKEFYAKLGFSEMVDYKPMILKSK